MDTEALRPPEYEHALSTLGYSDPRINRERNVGKQVCKVAASFFPSFDEFTWGSTVGRITRAVMSPRPEREYLPGLPPPRIAPELSSIPTEALVQSATALRFRLGWMALRDARFDVHLQCMAHIDNAFIDWLNTQDAGTLQTWAFMFVTDWTARGRPNEAAFRLARLKPTPLLMLWPFYCWRAAKLPGIRSDREEAEDAYIVGLVACHVRRMANEAMRFPPFMETQTGHDLSVTLPALQKKIHVANELGTTFSRAVYEEAEATASALLARWASTPPARIATRSTIRVGPTCPVCVGQAAGRRAPAPSSVPPFFVGCTCELLFDSEYLALLEADFVSDLMYWSARAGERSWRWFPLRRILLATAERQMLLAAVEHMKFTAAPEVLALPPRQALPIEPTSVGGGSKRARDGRTRTLPRAGPSGTLLTSIVAVLKSTTPEWASTMTIAAAVQLQLRLRFDTETERKAWLKGDLGRALRTLLANREVARRQTENWRFQVEWRLTTEVERRAHAPHQHVRPSLATKVVLPST